MRPADPPPPGPIVVRLPDGRVVQQSDAFHIGRDAGCDVQVSEVQVSRRHAEVSPHGGQWTVRDLQSSNGLFVEGERVEEAPVGAGINVTLGAGGPTVFIGPASSARPAPPPPAPVPPARPAEGSESLEDYAQRYFGTDDDDESVGGHTLMIRKAFQKVQGQQRRRQRWTIALVLMLAVAVAAYALREHQLVAKQEQLAEGDLLHDEEPGRQVAQLEQKTASSGNTPSQQEVAAYVEEQRQLESHYEEYAARLYDRKLNERDRLILKVTRTFGECELAAPPEYLHEVNRYIQKWQQTGRFARAVKLSQDLGYPQRIANAFLAQHLPPQFYYLALQESSFDAFISGPSTRWGIAKGMWQFIPETGAKYGLRIGPRASVSGADAARRPLQLGESHRRGFAVHQGHLRHRRPGIGPAGDCLLQLGRAPGHRHAAHDAGESAGTQFLAAAGEAPSAACRPTTTSSISCPRQSSARIRGFSGSISTAR